MGTPCFSSLRADMGQESSRRDDLEGLIYTLIFLHVGFLPWENLARDEEILSMKKSLSSDKVCEGCPREFATFLSYSRQLSFEQTPNYGMLIQLLESVATRKNIDLSTNIFDWNVMATVINYHPDLYDFIANEYFQPRAEDFPFKEDGHLDPSRVVDKVLER